jgi:RNA polymerase sigma factor (sigma-70 family)
VTSHRCIDRFRRDRRPMANPAPEPTDAAVMPQVGDVFLEERLRQLLAELPVDARIVMTLRYQEDLTPLEIADALDMPVTTVKSHLRRSLLWLRRQAAVAKVL